MRGHMNIKRVRNGIYTVPPIISRRCSVVTAEPHAVAAFLWATESAVTTEQEGGWLPLAVRTFVEENNIFTLQECWAQIIQPVA
jgi:hypothetical protein